jgi:hypothetical protein
VQKGASYISRFVTILQIECVVLLLKAYIKYEAISNALDYQQFLLIQGAKQQNPYS